MQNISKNKNKFGPRQFLMIGALITASLFLPSISFAENNKIINKSDEATTLFNQIRQQNGLTAMSRDPLLEKAARDQANRMAEKQKMGHSIGWGNDFGTRVRRFGIRGAAAENVAAGQPNVQVVLNAWMNSKGHRKNMLDPIFQHYGLAYATSPQKPNYRYWALVLGR